MPLTGEKPSVLEKKTLTKSFPKLRDKDWKKTSVATGHPDDPPFDPDTYNCIAWSLCRDDLRWIWWQVDALCNDNGIVEIEDFDCFYEKFGLKICGEDGTNDNPECKIRKIALFCINGTPTHTAKEIADGGWWESKIGGDIRIVHRLNQLEGGIYGNVYRCYCKEDKTANLDLCD